jgi:dTDP-4-amino-4,6-dideoxygalactose transaminase
MTAVEFVDLRSTHELIRGDLDRVWAAALDSSGFIGGSTVSAFEDAWAAACRTGAAIGVANGTDALELAMRALGLGPGDDVIVPTSTFFATPEAVVAVGARPVFVDVDASDLLVTGALVEAAITEATAAIITVHLYGQLAPMADIVDVADRHGLLVIEDGAQAHLAERDGRVAGGWGTAGAFSFYPGKNLGALGDGGAIVTDDLDLADRVRSLANHGRRLDSKNLHDVVGRNSRLDALQAAVLSVKLERLADWNARRRVIASWYRDALADSPVEPIRRGEVDDVFHLYVARSPHRDRLVEHLLQHHIGAGVHYPVPCHLQPAFASDAPQSLPVAERAARELLSLPMHPHLTESHVEQVIASIDDFFSGCHVD